MKLASLLLLGILASCHGNEADRARAEANCKQWVAQGVEKSMSQCVATTMQAYSTLDRTSAAPTGDGYYQAPPPPVYVDTPIQPSPNILPPTVRCQSVNAGLGTIQTVCR
jgi:hypothetical protein